MIISSITSNRVQRVSWQRTGKIIVVTWLVEMVVPAHSISFHHLRTSLFSRKLSPDHAGPFCRLQSGAERWWSGKLRRKQLWRRSYKKQFFLFDVAQQRVIPSKFDDFNLDSENDSEFCLYANWAPTLTANKDRIFENQNFNHIISYDSYDPNGMVLIFAWPLWHRLCHIAYVS